MKEPIGSLKKSTLSTRKSGLKKKQKPAGGKALARLKQFMLKRSLPFNVKQKSVRQSSATKLMMRATGSGIMDKIETGTKGNIEQQYSQALAATCQTVNKNTQADTTATPRARRTRSLASLPVSQWRFIGPSSISNGQTYGNSRVICSGRVSAIAIDPQDSNHILVGSGGGGVWESRNHGDTWSPRTDFMDSLKTGAIAFDPSNPTVVYCGTGEGNDGLGVGLGILKSTDGGKTWMMFCRDPFEGQDFFDLIVDPLDSEHLLAATNQGIYNSTDGGITWNRVRASKCWDIALTSTGSTGDEVLAAFSNGLFQSTNGGKSFSKVILQYGEGNFDRLAVAISKSNPGTAYACGVREGDDHPLLWRRETANGPWISIEPPARVDVSQAWYDWFLEVSPDREDEIYLGAIEAYRGNKGASKWKWVKISTKNGDDIHPDHHCITIDPANPENIFIGNDGGVFFSPNRGKNWQSLNPGLGITEIVYLAQNLNKPNWLIAGSQDNGTIRYTGKLQWEQIADGDGGDCGVNQDATKIYFHTYYGMGIERSLSKNKKLFWEWIGPNVDLIEGDIFYPPMEVNGEIVAQAGRSVFISQDSGETMWEIPLPQGQVATAMYIPTPDEVYVGTKTGFIFKVKWNGTDWDYPVALTSPRPDVTYISDLYVDPANLKRIWATSSNVNGDRCFRSDNGGKSWVTCKTGLPDLPINSIEVDPADPDKVWVAADVGVYQSTDKGKTWVDLRNGLPNAVACDLIYNPNERLLRVGMQNRGVWEMSIED